MPIDSRIALGVQPMRLESPVNALGQVMGLQQMQQQNALGQMKMDAYRSSQERAGKLNALLQGGATSEDLIRGGFMEEGMGLQKHQADIGKTGADTQRIGLETGVKALGAFKDLLPMVRSPEQMAQWIDAMYANPHSAALVQSMGTPEAMKARIPTDPQAFAQYLQQNAMGMEKFIANQTQVRGQDLSAATQRRGQDISANTAMRGQNMVDARSREANAAGKVPAGYRQKADGTLEFIPGGPADPNAAKRAAPTEFQGKSAIYGTRAEEADRLITELTGKYSPMAVNAKQAAGKVWGVGGALEAGANVALSAEAQKAEQAQRDFVNAVLRQESGAVISEAEFVNAAKQYFPQPGDTKDVIKQKAANRKLVIDGLKSNAGRALEGVENKQAGRGASGSWGDGNVVDFGSLK